MKMSDFKKNNYKYCFFCGKKFFKDNNDSIRDYCSMNCKIKSLVNIVYCENCGVEITDIIYKYIDKNFEKLKYYSNKKNNLILNCLIPKYLLFCEKCYKDYIRIALNISYLRKRRVKNNK